MIDYCINMPAMKPIRVKTSSVKIAKWLALYYGNSFIPNNDNLQSFIEIFEIDDHKYKIIYENQILITEYFIKDFSSLIRKITVCDKNFLILHGAAVEYQNEAYLFLAPSTGGKTTLTSYLCEKGFGYITDDMVIINKETLHVLNSYKPIHLRSRSLLLLRNLFNFEIETCYFNDGFTKRHIYQPKNICNVEVPIQSIFFLKRNNTTNRITQVPNVEKTILLLKSLMFNKDIDKMFKNINKFTRCSCFFLEYCNLEFVERAIKKNKGD